MFDNIPNMRHKKQSLKPFLDWLPLEHARVLEVGCFAGDGTLEFLRSDKVASIDCVDLFRGGYDPDDTASACDMREVLKKWVAQIADSGIVKPVTLHAFQEVGRLRPRTFDVCYIDGNHTEEAVYSDIKSCFYNFKPRIIAGHDFGVGKHPGVKRAVQRFFAGCEIKVFPDTTWTVKL